MEDKNDRDTVLWIQVTLLASVHMIEFNAFFHRAIKIPLSHLYKCYSQEAGVIRLLFYRLGTRKLARHERKFGIRGTPFLFGFLEQRQEYCTSTTNLMPRVCPPTHAWLSRRYHLLSFGTFVPMVAFAGLGSDTLVFRG